MCNEPIIRIQDFCVIFDMDGVIFDTERFFMNCCIPAAAKFGMEGIEEVYYQSIGRTEEDTRKLLIDNYHDEELLEQYLEEAVRIFRKRYQENGGLPEKPGARQLLTWLNEQGIRTALASSTRYEIVTKELRDAKLDQLLEEIVGGDMAARGKPEPDIFLMAAERLGVDPAECIVIEDSFNGIRAAHRAGMLPIMVPDMLPPDEEIRGLAYAVFGSLHEVREWMMRERKR